MGKKLLIIHGGAPSPVLNASLLGAIRQAKRTESITEVMGAIGGAEGVLRERFARLDTLSGTELEKLACTPGTAIGTSRYAIREEDYHLMTEIFLRRGIGYVLLNGGNGTMNTCGKLHEACAGRGICIVGIPKTVNNDIAVTDHTPGFGSAARYLAGITQEIGEDVFSLPIHVSIIEAMGRNAGWLSAASALAKKRAGDAPHLIYLPERPFREERFLEDVEKAWKKREGVVVVASEGLRGEEGEPIVKPALQNERAVYFGEVGSHLAGLVTGKLGLKARSEKPGICGRSSVPWISRTDQEEAILAGGEAVRAVVDGKSGFMVGLMREEGGAEYAVRTELIPIERVMLFERKMPDSFINEEGNGVTDAFLTWCRPLIGGELPDMIRLKERR